MKKFFSSLLSGDEKMAPSPEIQICFKVYHHLKGKWEPPLASGGKEQTRVYHVFPLACCKVV